ncbi:MAG: hypothetical protein ACP5UB_03250 [Candidatus Sumerlaeaceae bacterium]
MKSAEQNSRAQQRALTRIVLLLDSALRFARRIPSWGWVWIGSSLWHLFLIAHAAPNVFPDSGSYTHLAEAIRDNKWVPAFTFRTPGYPFFLYLIFSAAGWKNFYAVMVVQACLGATIPVLLYALYRLIVSQRWLAVVGGLAFLLDRYSIGLETVPLTEFLCGYTILLALVTFLYALRTRNYWWGLGAGFAAGVNFLIRPTFEYVYLAWVIAAVVLCWTSTVSREDRLRLLKWLCVYLLPFFLSYASWSFVVWRHTHVFAPSLQLGASMTNHTGAFMELAPDQYAKIRDIYVAEREKRGGDHINLFDEAGWKIADATSMTLWQLSLKFREINAYLIMHYPDRYLRQVVAAWDRIWIEDSHYLVDLTDPYATGKPVTYTSYFRFIATNALSRLIYLLPETLLWHRPMILRAIPWVLSACALMLIFWGKRECMARLTLVLFIGTIFYHILVHVLVQLTEFGRYKLPVQGLWFSLLLFSLATAGARVVARMRGSNAQQPPVSKSSKQIKRSR